MPIPVPDKDRIFSCSCSEKGDLWAVTHQGAILMRKGIHLNSPWGVGWLTLGSLENKSGIKEISLGSSSAWLLDNEGDIYFRTDISEKYPQGVRWLKCPSFSSKMSNICVSSSNELWAVNLFDNSLSLRYGVDDLHPNGLGWKRIQLKFKKPTTHDLSGVIPPVTDYESAANEKSAQEDTTLQLEPVKSPQKKNSVNIGLVDYSIYDEQEDVNENRPACGGMDEEIEANFKLSKQNSINVEKYTKKEDYSQVEKVNEDFDRILENLIAKDEKEEEEEEEKKHSASVIITDDTISNDGSANEIQSRNHANSFTSMTSSLSNATDLDFIDVDLHYCCSNSFSCDSTLMPAIWFESSQMVSAETNAKLNSKIEMVEWRSGLILELSNRTIREFVNVDRISHQYLNDVRTLRIFIFYNLI
jgi:hypothetical protein